MAGSGGHDQILQAEHLRLLPDAPLATVLASSVAGFVERGTPRITVDKPIDRKRAAL
jgi:hypothetical protein